MKFYDKQDINKSLSRTDKAQQNVSFDNILSSYSTCHQASKAFLESWIEIHQ